MSALNHPTWEEPGPSEPVASILDIVGIGMNTSGVDDWDELEPEVAAAVKHMDTAEHSYMLRGNLSVEDIREIIAAARAHIVQPMTSAERAVIEAAKAWRQFIAAHAVDGTMFIPENELIIAVDALTGQQPTSGACCDMHNHNCEPPSELCCHQCTEARHPVHPPGIACTWNVPVISVSEEADRG